MRNGKNEGWLKHVDFILIDVFCFLTSFLIAYKIQFGVSQSPFVNKTWSNIALIMLTMDMMVLVFGNYLERILHRGLLREAISVVKQAVLLELLTTFFLYLIHEGSTYSRTVVLLTGIIFVVLTWAARTGWKNMLRKRLKKCLLRYAVVGSSDMAQRLCDAIEQENTFHQEVVACIDTHNGQEAAETLESLLREKQVDHVILVEDQDRELFNRAVFLCEKYGCKISAVPFYHDVLSANASIETLGDMKLLNFRVTPLDSLYNAMIKRTFDILFSSVLLVITSPIMLFAAIGTRLSSPGPILFRQERVGRNKKNFTMLKFRSMQVTGTEDTGWSKNEDPRKTKFGSFIRKCSIDELPQLINVLKGDMSLVGPRPEIPFHVDHFMEEIPMYLVRLQVRPGITGWAQVNGLRGDTDISERVKYDIWYIENWSLSLDLKIVFKTVFGGMINSEKL